MKNFDTVLTVNEINAQNEKNFKDYVENAPLTADKIKALRFQTEKWNELYLKTFGLIDGLNEENLAYHGKRIASIVTKANYKRSGNSFEYCLYLSVCGYDYFTGSQKFYEIGGDEIISESIYALNNAYNHGARKLDDIVIIDGTERTAFRYACYYINKYIHAQRNHLEKISAFDIERVISINTAVRDRVSQERYEILENIISHLKLTANMLRYLDYAVNGLSHREIARLENKAHTTINESFRAIKTKFIKYCTENKIDESVANFLDEYITA